jgi:hypothetical protein
MKLVVISPLHTSVIPDINVTFARGVEMGDIIIGDIVPDKTGFLIYRQSTVSSGNTFLHKYFGNPTGFFMGRLCGKPLNYQNDKYLKVGLSVYSKPESLYVSCLMKDRPKEIVQQYLIPQLTAGQKPPVALSGNVSFTYNKHAKRTEITLYVGSVSLIPLSKAATSAQSPILDAAEIHPAPLYSTAGDIPF